MWGGRVRIRLRRKLDVQVRLRRFHTRDEPWQRLSVACGSSGEITIDIHNTQALTNPTNPLIIYLPPTGIHNKHNHPPIPRYLFHPSSTLAKINYRWNIPSSLSPTTSPLSSHPSFKNHGFPTPLHDILHAYTYLTTTYFQNQYSSQPSPPNYLQPKSSSSAFPRLRTPQRPLLIYGSFLSGALATSLALTESRTSVTSPVKVAGLIVRDGVFDFSGLAFNQSSPASSSPSSNHPDQEEIGHGKEGTAWSEQYLVSMRKNLFSSPEKTFDSFASPIFFFRTSGVDIPKFWPGEENLQKEEGNGNGNGDAGIWLDGFSGFDADGEPIFSPSPSPSPSSSSSSTSPSASNENGNGNEKAKRDGEQGSKKIVTDANLYPPPRKANLKFPPPGTDLVIPPTLFLLSPSPLPPQPPSSTKPTAKTKKSHASKSASKSASSSTLSKKKILAQLGIGGINPSAQTEEMSHLMTRSIVLYEFGKGGVGGDMDEDPREVAERRVGIVELGNGQDGDNGVGEEGGEEEIREWVGEVLGV